jgi:hypothetical protein
MHELMAADSVVVSCCDSDETRRWTHAEICLIRSAEALHPDDASLR